MPELLQVQHVLDDTAGWIGVGSVAANTYPTSSTASDMYYLEVVVLLS